MAWDKTKPAAGSAMVSSDIRYNMEELDRLMRSGNNTTNGESGRTITISPALQDTNYAVDVEFVSSLNCLVGDIWITDKATNGFVLRNSGDSNIAFNWATRPKI